MKKLGFTLVELSIVLVIIGLLIGGILAGQEIVAQSKTLSVINKLNSYTTAYYTFYSKFNKMPGDIPNAVQIGLCKDSAGNNNCAYTGSNIANGIGNGNGDKKLRSSTQGTAHYDGEIANYWVHLSNGGFVKDSFSQVSNCEWNGGSSNCKGIAGLNLPKAPVGVSIGVAQMDGHTEGFSSNVDGKGGLYYTIGSAEDNDLGVSVYGCQIGWLTCVSNTIAGNTLTPEQAYVIDTKLDDGFPKSVKVETFRDYGNVTANLPSGASYTGFFSDNIGSATECHTSSVPNPGASRYNINLKSKLCSLKILVTR